MKDVIIKAFVIITYSPQIDFHFPRRTCRVTNYIFQATFYYKQISNPTAFIFTLDSSGYYAILGVPEQATYPELKRAYRRLARKYHPDRNRSFQAEIMIKKINAAFEVLSDRDKRAEYDKEGFSNGVSGDRSQYEDEVINMGHSNKHNQYEPQWQEHKTKAPEVLGTASGLLSLPKGRFQITIEPSLCLAFGSCEILAPKVFVVEKNKRINPKARIESETGAKFESILSAAQTCPTKAIKIVDRYTGEQIYP